MQTQSPFRSPDPDPVHESFVTYQDTEKSGDFPPICSTPFPTPAACAPPSEGHHARDRCVPKERLLEFQRQRLELQQAGRRRHVLGLGQPRSSRALGTAATLPGHETRGHVGSIEFGQQGARTARGHGGSSRSRSCLTVNSPADHPATKHLATGLGRGVIAVASRGGGWGWIPSRAVPMCWPSRSHLWLAQWWKLFVVLLLRCGTQRPRGVCPVCCFTSSRYPGVEPGGESDRLESVPRACSKP